MPDQLPTVDDVLGPASTPTVDDVLGPPKPFYMQTRSGPTWDQYVENTPMGAVLNAFGQGAAHGWGTATLGLSPETEKDLRDVGIFSDVQKGQTGPVRAFNEAIIRPAAVGLDAILRGTTSLFTGAQAAVQEALTQAGAPRLGRDVAAIPEAFFGQPFGLGTPKPVDIPQARSLNVIGDGEAGWKGTGTPIRQPETAVADMVKRQQEAVANADTPGRIPFSYSPGALGQQPTEAAVPGPYTPSRSPPMTVHEAARDVAPTAFHEYDGLIAQRDTLRQRIADASEKLRQNAEDQAPHAAEIKDLERRLEDTTPRLRKKYEARLEEIRPEHDAFLADEFKMGALTRDTPEITELRNQLQQTDYRLRDLSPEVSAAYREADRRFPPEEAPRQVEEAPRVEQGGRPPSNDLADLDRQLSAEDARFQGGADFYNEERNPRRAYQEAMESVPSDIRDRYIAHGISATRGESRTEALSGILRDKPDNLTAGPLLPTSEESATGVAATRTDAPYVLIYDASKPTSAGPEFVVVNTREPAIVESARRTFPNVRIGSPAEAAAELRNRGSAAQEIPPAESRPVAPPLAPEAREPLNIVHDVTRQLVEAGRPDVEAQAAAELVASHYATRAARFEGALGTAEELYAREAPEIRAGDVGGRGGAAAGKLRLREFAQEGRGSTIPTARAVITLFEKADASTFVHETGHVWLEELMRDAVDQRAPEALRNDAAAVRKWVGAAEEGRLTTKQHEQFARGFERYLMEGVAPSPTLAGVFSQFKQWLTSIYRTVQRLKAPITADIRDVFDRLITLNPEKTVTAPDLPFTFKESTPIKATPFERVPKEPKRLVNFLRESWEDSTGNKRAGGVVDTSGDVSAIAGGPKGRPGLINAGGDTLDNAALRAWEAGYFPSHGTERPTVNDLLDAIGEDIRGNARYSMHDANAVEEFRAALDKNAEVDRLATQFGVDPKGLTTEQFYDAVSAKMSEQELADTIRRHEDALTEAFDTAAAEAREEGYLAHGEPRTLEELENAYRQEIDTRSAGEGPGDGAGPGPATGRAGDSEGGTGPRGGGAGPTGRSGEAPGTAQGGAEGVGRSEQPTAPGERFGTPDGGFVDKAGNIRLDLLGQPESVNAAIREAAEANNDFVTARRGVLSDATVLDLADALGMDASTLNRRAIGEAFNAEEVVASRKLLIQSATEVRDAMQKAATGSDADVMAYAEAKMRHQMIQEQVAGITAEAGRALRAFRDMSSLEGAREAAAMGDFLKDATGRTLFQLREEAQRGLQLDTPQQLSKFIHDSRRATAVEMGMEVWVNALLSGPMTHATNMVSNALVSLYSIPETAVAGGVGAVRRSFGGTEGVYAGEASARLWGVMQGAQDGVRAGWSTFKAEDMIGSKLEQPRFKAVPGPVGTAVRLPGRMLSAEDAAFKALAYRQQVNALAYRQATREGLTGEAFSARLSDLMQNPTEAMMADATKSAFYQTFNNELGETGRAIQMFANSHPLVKLVIPFIRTPLNIVKFAQERSLFGLFSSEVRANLSGVNGAAAMDTQVARIALGTAVSVSAVGLAAQGLLTGGGPSDPRERAVLMQTGWQPYSVKVGDTYYSYQRMEPLGSLMGVAADMYEVGHAATTGETEHLAKMILASVSKNLTSKTWLKGPSDLIQAVTDPDRYGETYIKSLAGTVVPSVVAQTTRVYDPYLRDARSVLDQIKSRIPGLSETVLPRRDVWGEPIRLEGGLGPDLLSPIYESRLNNDPVNQRLLALKIYPSRPERKIRGVELTAQQYDDFARISGRMSKVRMDALIGAAGFSALPEFVQGRVIRETLSDARESARTLIMMQNPEIIQKAVDAKREIGRAHV